MFEISLGPLGTLPIATGVWMTWLVMIELLLVTLLLRRHLATGGMSKLENLFEMFMEYLVDLTREIVRSDPQPYIPLVGTLFIFVFVSNLLGMIPGAKSPTGDLSVTAALAVVVFCSVPFYGIRKQGPVAYLKSYLEPNPFMLPFNLLGEITRTLSLAVRLFGNIMSGEFLLVVVIGVVTTLLRGYAQVFIPFAFLLTLFLSVLSLITAAIQAYIFTVLALVYIGAAVEQQQKREKKEKQLSEKGAS